MIKYIKIGNTSIRADAGKSVSLNDFKSSYSKVFGDKVESVYYQLGGEKPKPKKSTVKDTKDKG